METAKAENGIRTRRHVLGQEPDQQWRAAPQNGSDIVGLVVVAWGVALCTPELGPDTCSRPAVTELPNCLPRSAVCIEVAFSVAFCASSAAPCSWPSKQALGWLAFKRHFLADTVCASSLHTFSHRTFLDLCGRALKRGRRLQFVQIYYRLASTMLRCTDVQE